MNFSEVFESLKNRKPCQLPEWEQNEFIYLMSDCLPGTQDKKNIIFYNNSKIGVNEKWNINIEQIARHDWKIWVEVFGKNEATEHEEEFMQICGRLVDGRGEYKYIPTGVNMKIKLFFKWIEKIRAEGKNVP